MSAVSNDVLVVGDWYVDAHWVVAPHESETASRRGDMHSLAVHGLESTVRALCGAGQVANLLSLANRHDRFGQVFGLGSWAHGDDPYIQALLDGKNEGDNPLKLKSSIDALPTAHFEQSQRVFNLAAAKERAGTNRVIRIYRQSSAAHYRLVGRIDFETPTPQIDLDVLRRLPSTIRWILVKDHGRGVISECLIDALAHRFPRASWYVSTKKWSVLDHHADHRGSNQRLNWLGRLKGRDVRLILFQQEAAARARTNDLLFPEVGNWLVEDGIPTRSGLEAIDNVIHEFTVGSKRHPPTLILLPSRESLIARVHSSNTARRTDAGTTLGYAYLGPLEKPHESFVPRASALFASLFCSDRVEGHEPIDSIRGALQFTAIWVQEEGRRIVERNWIHNQCRLDCGAKRDHLISMPSGELPSRRIASVSPRSESRFDWNRVKAEYGQAFTAWPLASTQVGFGVVQRGQERFLELWRAKSDVPGVITIVRAKRHMIRVLSQELEQFVKGRRRRHKSFLIVDDPGGGKSTLVRKVADSKKMRCLQINITELTRRTDLLEFFDTVVTTQAQDPEVPLLVFVDEINALLENQPVFSAFLAPLEDGHYNRNGKSFTIEPCVWVFAGTDDLTPAAGRGHSGQHSNVLSELRKFLSVPDRRPEQRAEGSIDQLSGHQMDRSHKKSDFASRLTLPPFILNDPFGYREPERILDRHLINEALKCAQYLADEETRREITQAAQLRPSSRDPKTLARKLLADRLLGPGRALERVYIGAEMITRLYPNIERISLRVLKAFAYLPDRWSLRDLRHDLENMVNVQRGEIRWQNLPSAFHRHVGEERVVGGIVTSLDRPRGKTLAELCSDVDDSEMVWVRRALDQSDNGWTGLNPQASVQPARGVTFVHERRPPTSKRIAKARKLISRQPKPTTISASTSKDRPTSKH